MADVIRRIKGETGLVVTLSLGERTADELHAWRRAGAGRYLLRIETGDLELYDRIHPPRPGILSAVAAGRHPRMEILRTLRDEGYEVGSGVLLGVPGQTYASLAADIDLFRALDLDMIGVGPFIANPALPPLPVAAAVGGTQAPATAEMACKVVALTRLVRPDANIPSTTAVATISPAAGRRHGLDRGANVVMPNVTPACYSRLYEIYPSKAGSDQTPADTQQSILRELQVMGRPPGVGPGNRRRFTCPAPDRNRPDRRSAP
jgi:biotin synthase